MQIFFNRPVFKVSKFALSKKAFKLFVLFVFPVFFFVSTCIVCSKPNDNNLNEVRQPPDKATSQPLYQEGFLRHTTYFTLGERI